MVNIIEPSIKILTPIDGDMILKHIEECGRTCYQSYGNKTEDTTSAKQMIGMLIKSGHESVLEHFSISVKMKVDVGCYDDKTYVLTENGWKLFKDLQPNEKVYTKKDDGEVLLVPFLSKIEKDWDGILHHYHSTQVNLKVTPDHNMWVFDVNKRSSKTKIWKFLESQQLTNKSYSFDKSTDKTKNHINRIIHIPSVYRQCGFYTKEFNGHTFNNLDFFELLGWWITDGSLERIGNHFCVVLHQSKERGRNRIEQLLKNMNLSYNLYKNRYRIKSTALADYIKDMFYYNKNKKTGYKKSYDIAISSFIRNAYTNEIEAFLKGVLGGDGSVYTDGRKIIYTASKQFALDLIELCFKCGMTANYYMSNTTDYPCSYKNNGAVYVVSICRTEKHWFNKTQKNYSEEYYKGKVYCVELEKYHRLFVMREGKTCWCGNCYKDLTRHRAGTAFSIESTRFCVAGDTKLRFSNNHVHLTIEELYNNMIHSKNGAWKRFNIGQVNEETGMITFSKLKNVFYNGEKETFKIKTKLGYELVCTEDHEIYTPNGFIPLCNLNSGDKIYVNGATVSKPLYQNYDWLYYQSITLNKTFKEIAQEFGFNLNTLKNWKRKLNIPSKGTGYFNIGRTPWNKGLSEHNDSRIKKQADALREYRYDRWANDKRIKKINTSEYQKYMQSKCIICGTENALEVHHIDKDRTNNYPENLMTVCEKCHSRIHHQSLEHIFADEIISKEYVGVQKVYDIEMDSIYHNYNANGVIVHNCNYSKDKFDNQITFIKPCNIEYGTDEYNLWEQCMRVIEVYYNNMAQLKCKPDQLRMILPHSTAAEVSMTANLRAWRHIFKMRCAKAAHPSVRQIMLMTLDKFHSNIPVIFDDVYEQFKEDIQKLYEKENSDD